MYQEWTICVGAHTTSESVATEQGCLLRTLLVGRRVWSSHNIAGGAGAAEEHAPGASHLPKVQHLISSEACDTRHLDGVGQHLQAVGESQSPKCVLYATHQRASVSISNKGSRVRGCQYLERVHNDTQGAARAPLTLHCTIPECVEGCLLYNLLAPSLCVERHHGERHV